METMGVKLVRFAFIPLVLMMQLGCTQGAQESGAFQSPTQSAARSPELELLEMPIPPTPTPPPVKTRLIFEINQDDFNGMILVQGDEVVRYFRDPRLSFAGRFHADGSIDGVAVPVDHSQWGGYGGLPRNNLSGIRVIDLRGANPGLDPPTAKVIFTGYSGVRSEIHLGNFTPDHQKQYAQLVGDPTIYVVDVVWLQWFNGNLRLDTQQKVVFPGDLPIATGSPRASPRFEPNDPDTTRLRGYVVQWLLANCEDNRPGEEANFRHGQLAGFSHFQVQRTGDASWSFTSGSETWNIQERPTLTVTNPHGYSWCLQ